MKHYFNFDHITIGDLAPLLAKNPSGADMLAFADKVILGGVYALPASETQAVIDETGKQMAEWIKSITVDNAVLEDMLKGVEGI